MERWQIGEVIAHVRHAAQGQLSGPGHLLEDRRLVCNALPDLANPQVLGAEGQRLRFLGGDHSDLYPASLQRLDTHAIVHIEAAEDLPLVYADKHLVEQAIINMITNAAEALKGTGEPGYIQVATQETPAAVLITIKDSGPGIPLAIRDKIFDPYFTTKSDGSGIGLSLCQRIITDHGGNIEVSSSDMGGTQFVIRIPREN